MVPCLVLCVTAACSTGTNVATATGGLVGKTATTAVAAGGKVAGAAVSGAATVVKTTVTTTGSIAGTVAKTAFVTVVDSATGTARQIPWVEGMRLYAATKTVEATAGLKAIQILRGSQVITVPDPAKLAAHTPGPQLQPGDIVTLRNLKP